MDSAVKVWRDQFMAQLAQPLFVEALFDRMSDLVFSVKDRTGRYITMSQACAERCGLSHKSEAIGKTAHQLFPAHMADRYVAQDEALFATGEPVIDNLDLTLFNDRQPGWCLSNKTPLHDAAGSIIGLACLSRDLIEPSRSGLIDENMARTVDIMRERFAEPLRIEVLAEQAGLNMAQFERRMKKIFQLSPSQYLIKVRIDAAAAMLVGSDIAIAEIALACGFCDQSALSRQFKQLTGMSPREYRLWQI